MSENPYSSPTTVAAIPLPGRWQYRPPHVIMVVFRTLFIANAVLSVLATIAGALMTQLLQQGANSPTGIARQADIINGVLLAAFALAACQIAVSLSCIVIYCIWVYRANSNARALGAQGMQYSPGWAVGWNFVPFANLVVPMQVASELFYSSDPATGPTNWKSGGTPSLIGWWWGMFLGARFSSFFFNRLSDDSNAEELLFGMMLMLLTSMANAAACVLVIRVASTIVRRQQEKYDRQKDDASKGADGAEQVPPVVNPSFVADPKS